MKLPSKPARPKTALITGASSGIGRALALRLSKKGFSLILFGRNEIALRELGEELASPHRIVLCDLATEEGQARLVACIHDDVPDLVVNNAGIGFYGEESAAEAEGIMALNCRALVASTHAAVRRWRELRQPGTVVNVSSALAFTPTPGMSVYAASKAFALSFSEAEDAVARKWGSRVLTACPGRVVTSFGERASRGKRKSKQNFLFAMSADRAAACIVKQIEKQKAVYVFDWRTRFLIALSKILPRRLVMYILARNVQTRL